MPSTGLNSTTGILLCCQQKLIQHFLQSAAICNASKYLSSYFTEPFWILPTSKSLSQKAFVSLISLIPTCMLTAASMNLFLLLLLSSLFQSPLFKNKQTKKSTFFTMSSVLVFHFHPYLPGILCPFFQQILGQYSKFLCFTDSLRYAMAIKVQSDKQNH